MGLRHHPPRRRVVLGHGEIGAAGRPRLRIARGKQEARGAIGEARLADAFGPAEQPGMVHAARCQRVDEGPFAHGMADHGERLARVRRVRQPVGFVAGR